MESESIMWSAPCALFDTKDHLDVGGKPGVYRIRAFTDRNEPMMIHRVNGVDSLGILHIGKSKNLGRRIRTFRQAAEGLKAVHHAGCEFLEWGFESIIPRNRSRYDYAITRTDQEALKVERYLHEEYRKKYFDRPPLDGTSGQVGQ
jgi:hypothetical protein